MRVATLCVLVLSASVAQAAARAPLQIAVVEYPGTVLVGKAQVAIYAPNGLCIRRGETGVFGNPYDAERVEPLDPAFKELRVTVRKIHGYAVAEETAMLTFERGAWRSKTRIPEPPTRPRERLTQAALTSGANQAPGRNNNLDQGPIEIPLRVPPLPVCRTAPWQAFICGGVPPALPSPPCGPPPPPAPDLVWPPSSIAPSGTAISAELEAYSQRAARITESGRPPVPEFSWARYGSVWIDGRHGMFWQSRVLPENVPNRKTDNKR